MAKSINNSNKETRRGEAKITEGGEGICFEKFISITQLRPKTNKYYFPTEKLMLIFKLQKTGVIFKLNIDPDIRFLFTLHPANAAHFQIAEVAVNFGGIKCQKKFFQFGN